MKEAWLRTKDRWLNYFLISLQYIYLPLLIAFVISGIALASAPWIISFTQDPQANAALQVVLAALAIIVPVVTIVGAIYRNILGSIALVKAITDSKKDRKTTIAESKALIFPYMRFITVLSLLNVGFIVFIPVTLFTILFYMQIWSQFALFSFVSDDQKGTYNLWKALGILRANFWTVTGHALLIQIATLLFANIGNLLSALIKSTDSNVTAALASLQFLITIASFLISVFVTAYMYGLYARVTHPQEVKTPKVWVTFSIIGWIILIVLAAIGINYVVSQIPQLLTPSTR